MGVHWKIICLLSDPAEISRRWLRNKRWRITYVSVRKKWYKSYRETAFDKLKWNEQYTFEYQFLLFVTTRRAWHVHPFKIL